jgi:hypothetical protein
MAVLVLVTMLVKQPFAEEAREWASFCNMGIESFEWMIPLHAASKSRAILKAFIDTWKAKTETGIEPIGNKRRRSYLETSRVGSQNMGNTSSHDINYLLHPQQSRFHHTFIPPNEFQTAAHISPQRSDSSYSQFNQPKYDVSQTMPYSTQTLEAAALEVLQSFSGTGLPNQGIFTSDSAMGWIHNFEDFGDLLSSNTGGQQGI